VPGSGVPLPIKSRQEGDKPIEEIGEELTDFHHDTGSVQ